MLAWLTLTCPSDLRHACFMTKVAASRLRASTLRRVSRGARVVVQSSGRDMAALVPLEDLEALERLEDEADVRAAREALAEPGPNIPWEKVKADLGL